MEPMALGSPSSPSANPSPYLPPFLMGGETPTPTTPRSNTLSPNKGGRNISFAPTPVVNTPQDFNRSLSQKTLFGSSYQQTPQGANGNVGNYAGTPNTSHAGPPIQGLFDSLNNERNQIQTPTRNLHPQTLVDGAFPAQLQNISGFNMSQSFHQPPQPLSQFNESYLSNASFNSSRAVISPLRPNSPVSLQNSSVYRGSDFWVTVYGFPPSATSTILQHFARFGTIVDKIFPPQNGNWVHLKYSSRHERDKALSYNEQVLNNNIMIGVTECKDKSIIDKENSCDNNMQPLKIRSLVQTAYTSAQAPTNISSNSTAPQKTTGIMNKAMDLFFGW